MEGLIGEDRLGKLRDSLTSKVCPECRKVGGLRKEILEEGKLNMEFRKEEEKERLS